MSFHQLISYFSSHSSIDNIETLYAPFPLNIPGYKWLKIYTTNLNTYNYSSLNKGMNGLLSIIPKDIPAFSLICYNNFTDTKYIINNNTLDSLDITVLIVCVTVRPVPSGG